MSSMWEIKEYEDHTNYKNTIIDLAADIYKLDNNKREVRINYMGYNMAITMMIWEFWRDLELADLGETEMIGDDPFKKSFVINEGEELAFLEEVYFFLVDNDITGCFGEELKVD